MTSGRAQDEKGIRDGSASSSAAPGAEGPDRELLEKAAKAAGYTPVRMEDGSMLLYGIQEPWNPLTDDGDALRLAVRLGVDREAFMVAIIGAKATSVASDPSEAEPGEVPHGSDPYAATRRAIVRAAAKMGEQL